MDALIHHLPSWVVAISMFMYGPKHPFVITGIMTATVVLCYVVMGMFGISLREAQDAKWFYNHGDLMDDSDDVVDGGGGTATDGNEWLLLPPAPFGFVNSIYEGNLNVVALKAGLPFILPTAFVYTLRCSLHAAALTKNLSILAQLPKPRQDHDDETDGDKKGAVKPTELRALFCYGMSLFGSVVMGGVLPVLPNLAATSTMYKLGAYKPLPQVGSILLVVVFYVTNFELVTYIPKMVFSALIVLLGINLTVTFFWKSFFKIQNKMEWMVVPLIVVCSFVIGSLNSVLLGVALSLFIFVNSFYRTGVVKFLTTGLTVRSTIERAFNDACWLDHNGDMIQVLVLQNYLFFGNASSCLRYIDSMFEEPLNVPKDIILPPVPKVLIIDFAIVTGFSQKS
mmetsp:Transcript_43146/g.52339  ORF Transcript_43146/g.52339 Transcript_43146/m.52339 type:complete len:396 (+) Transcript_43146:1105-2292(+)